jgi:hypothetical protein
MRPLNRPMFRYGGPIKEGIMNGMKDRPGYQNAGKVGGYFSNLAAKTANLFNPLKKLKPVQKFLQRQKIEIPPARVQSTTGMGGVTLTPGQIKAGMGTTGVPFMTRAKQFASLNPKFTYGAAPFAVSGAVTATPTILDTAGKVAKATALQATDLLVPDFIFDQDKYFENKKIAELNKNIEANKKTKTLQEKEKTTGDTVKKIDRDKEIQANRERYYKILGIDKMKKDAAYDSLIDASKIIQQEGGDLKGAIRSGNLQTQIIDAISKNLDKSADIKRQIDAAIVKAEIDKDVNREKNTLDKLVKEKQLKVLDKQLEGGSLQEVLVDLGKQGIVPEGPELASLALRKDINIPSGHTLNTKDVNTFLKDNPTLTVVDYLNDQNLKLQQAGKGNLNPGNYVVGKNILKVGEDGTVIDVLI